MRPRQVEQHRPHCRARKRKSIFENVITENVPNLKRTWT